jgi:folate-binding protein YgfZ
LSAYLTPLADEGLIHFKGPDTPTFLQGQLTCDVRKVSPDRALLGAYCTPKGRVIVDFMLGQAGQDHWLMRVTRDTIDHCAQTLSKYIVFSKSTLDTQNADWVVLGCWGQDAARLLEEHFGNVPAELNASIATSNYVIIQRDDSGQRFELWLNSSECLQQLQNLTANCETGAAERWAGMDIEAGHARICAATTESLTPQALNYDLTGHIDFRKGCYTGQEVVARLHYKGESKRRVFAARVDPVGAAEVGSPVTNSDGQAVGSVINRGLDATHRPIVLLELAIKASGQDLLLASNAEKSPITLFALPYSAAAKI